jgi:hypothetical protein
VPEARRLPLRKGPAPRREDESESEWEGESATADEELEMEDGLESEAATGAFEGTEFEEPEADGEAIFEVEDEAEDEGEAFDVGEAESEDHEATDHEASDHDVAPEGLEEETEFEDLGDFQAAGMSSPVAGAGSQPEAPDGVRSAVALLDLAPDQEHPALTAVRQLMAFQFGPDLQQGSTGVAVTALQNGLTTLGHQVTATGTFGQDTVNAVRAFQRARGLCPSGIVRTQTKVEMVRALTRRNNAGFDPLPEAIVRVARNQLQRWQVNGVFIRETDKAASPILIEYYRDGLCPRQPPTDKEVQDDVWHCGNPWSAAFVSWVMRSAGAGRDFNYSAAHVDYVRDARRNRCNNVAANPFWAYRATEVAPELGDLVCRSRHRRPADATTYENVMQGGARPLHCDIVTTAAQGGRIMVTGGNVAIPQPGASQIHGQTVAQRPLRVDAAGMLDLTGDQSKIFAVIRCRGRAPGVPQPC